MEYTVRLVFADHRLVALAKPPGLSLATSRSMAVSAVRRLVQAVPHLEREAWGLDPAALWLVHRLDIGTSGLVLLARDAETHRELTRALVERRIEKTYLALVWGRPRPATGEYGWPLAPVPRDRRRMQVATAGKPALTTYRVLASVPHVSLVELSPRTGRTHQLRVHLAHAGHPVVGDDFYGGPRHRGIRDPELRRCLAPDHTFLHAWRLALPALGGEPPLFLAAPLPAAFANAVAALGGEVEEAARRAGVLAPA